MEEEIKNIVEDTIKETISPVVFPEVQDVHVVNGQEIESDLLEKIMLKVLLAQRLSTLKGDEGREGKIGPVGKSVTGPQGPRGSDGTDGKSIPGSAGVDGKDGKDFSEEIVNELKDKIEELKDNLKDMRTRLANSNLGRQGPVSINRKFLYNQTPTGAINGSNAAFVLQKAPVSNSQQVFLNGVRMRVDATDEINDYSISGKTITFSDAPLTDDIILVDLEHI